MGKLCFKTFNTTFNIDEKKILKRRKYSFFTGANSIFKILIITLSFFVLGIGSIYGQTVTVPSANTNTGSVNDPFGSYWGFERSAMIYTSTQIGGTSGNITSVGFYLNSSTTPGEVINCRIYMKMRTNLFTSTSTYATETTGATLVYGPLNIPASTFSTAGWVTIPLTTPFNYTGGTNHLEIIIETNTTGGGNEGSTAKQFRYSSPGNNQHYQSWNQDNTAPTGNGSRSTNRPNVQLTFGSVADCTGTPAPGNTITSSTSVVSGSTVNLSLQNATTGSGVTYQWQSAPTSTGTWTNIGGATAATYTATVTANTWYQCIVTCSGNSGTSSPVGVSLTYCNPSSTSVDGTGITNVSFGVGPTVNNSTSTETNNYGNYSAQIGALQQGTTATVAITYSTSIYDYNTVIWVDWNNDFDFNDSGETVYTGLSSTTSPNTLNAVFTVPANQSLGNYRMRIGGGDSSAPGACSTGLTYTCWEDYTIEVIAAPSCASPLSLISAITSLTSASISWTAPTDAPANGYEYYVSTSSTAPTSGSVATGSTSAGITTANLSGLTANTTYYFWVRSNCGGDTSSWVSGGSFIILEGDNCELIQDLATLNSPYSGTTVGYSNSFTNSCLNGTGGDRIFKIDVPNGFQLFIGQSSNGYDSKHRIAYGGTCPGTTEINTGYVANFPTQLTNGIVSGCTDDDDLTHYFFDNNTGSTQTVYWIQDGFSTGQGTFTLEWEMIEAPTCVVPSALTSSILTSSTAAISWTAPTNAPANGYEYYVATSSTAPTAGSVATGSTNAGVTTANLSGLSANTTYYFWVRSNCGGDTSSWVSGGSFIILEGNNCDLIQDLATLNSPYSGTTVGYSNSFTNSCLTGTGGDRIFKIDVPNGFQLFIGQSTNGYDSKLRIAYGGTCPGTTEINTGYVANFPTQLTNGTVSGCIDDDDLTHYFFNNNTGSTQTVYWIQDGYSTEEGTFTLEWELIQPSDPITITPSSATSFCSGNSVDLTASSSASYSYSWSPTTGLNTTNGATVTANPSTTTTYTVTGDNGAGMTNTQTITITIIPSPTDVIIGNVSETVCRNSVQTLSASGGDFINVSILTEDFNGAATGWTTINNSTGGTPANAAWMFYLSGTSFYSNDNTDFVMSDSDAQGAGTTDTSLTSPVFSLEGLTTASLSFYHYFNNLGATDSATVQISTNGLNWTNLESYTSDQGSATNFALKTISLDAYVGNPSVQIRFQYNASWAWYWAIDNFSVSGSGQNIIWSPTTDLYTDSSCTTAYNSENLATVYAKPTANRTYTATSTLGSCEKTDEITFTVESATYDGTSWSSAPAPNKEIVFNGNYSSTGNLEGCSCTVNSGNVVINSNHTLKLVNEISSNGGSITFENNSSLIQINNVTNSGNIIYKRVSPQTVINTDYVYWSSPVSGQTVPSTGLNYFWNNAAGTSGNWVGAAGQQLTAGKGVIMRGIATRNFIGVPFNGELTVDVHRRNIAGYNDNWNLVGNPYPSAISADEFLTDSNNTAIEGSIAIWTHSSPISSANTNPFYGNFTYNYSPSDYIIYNLSGSQSGPDTYNGFIPAGQGFFVKYDNDDNASPTAASSSIKFKNSMRLDASGSAYSNTQFFRNSENTTQNIEKNRIWIDIVNGANAYSRTVVGYIENATDGKDRLYDSSSSVTPSTTSIYSLIGNDKMSIQGKGLPFNNSDFIPLGFNAGQAGNFTIAIHALDGLFVNQDVFLLDTQLNVIHEIKLSPYTFTAPQGENNTRFQLIFNNETLSNPDFDTDKSVIIVNNDKLEVISNVENIESIKVFDLLGRTIYLKNNINNKEFIIPLSQERAPLIVKIKLANGIYVERKTLY